MTRREQITQSGDWLYGELVRAGSEDDLAKQICFAAGQRQAMLNDDQDLMGVCRELLERYKRGDWDTPGMELAMKLLTEKFGDPMDREALLAWAVSRAKRVNES